MSFEDDSGHGGRRVVLRRGDEATAAANRLAVELAETIKVEGDEIVLNIAYEYAIPVRECNTHQRILAWVVHLSHKTWMQPRHLRRFVDVACAANGLERPKM